MLWTRTDFIISYADIIEARKGKPTQWISSRGTRAWDRSQGNLKEKPYVPTTSEERVVGTIIMVSFYSEKADVAEIFCTMKYDFFLRNRRNNKTLESVARRLSLLLGRRIIKASGMGMVQVVQGQKIKILGQTKFAGGK